MSSVRTGHCSAVLSVFSPDIFITLHCIALSFCPSCQGSIMQKVAFGFVSVQHSLGSPRLCLCCRVRWRFKFLLHFCLAPAIPQCSTIDTNCAPVLISFHLSDVPELPEEVEAVVCDAGDLAEGELCLFPSYQQNRDSWSQRWWWCFMSYISKTMLGEMKQVDVAGHPVLLCRDQGHLKVKATFVFLTKTKMLWK